MYNVSMNSNIPNQFFPNLNDLSDTISTVHSFYSSVCLYIIYYNIYCIIWQYIFIASWIDKYYRSG